MSASRNYQEIISGLNQDKVINILQNMVGLHANKALGPDIVVEMQELEASLGAILEYGNISNKITFEKSEEEARKAVLRAIVLFYDYVSVSNNAVLNIIKQQILDLNDQEFALAKKETAQTTATISLEDKIQTKFKHQKVNDQDVKNAFDTVIKYPARVSLIPDPNDLTSYEAILKFIEKNPKSKRAGYWEEFLAEKKDDEWLKRFEAAHAKIEQIYAYNLAMPDIEQRKAFADLGVIGKIILSSKMNADTFLLINNFYYDIRRELTKQAGVPEFKPRFLTKTIKEELEKNIPSAQVQFAQDKVVYSNWMFDKKNKYPDANHKKRVDVVKRLLLALSLNADELHYRDTKGGPLKNFGAVNGALPKNDQIPLVSLISHGGRNAIQLDPIKKGEDPYAFLNWVLGGAGEKSSTHCNEDAVKEGKVVYSRWAATHSLEVKPDGTIIEVKPKPPAMAADTAAGRHMGMEIGLNGPESGSFGHLYIYFKAPTETEPGGLLFGVEGSAPLNLRGTAASFFGQVEPQIARSGDQHTTAANSSFISPTDGTKWKNINHPIKPFSENGIQVNLTAAAQKNLMKHKAEEFTENQLAEPAGVVSSPALTNAATPGLVTIHATPATPSTPPAPSFFSATGTTTGSGGPLATSTHPTPQAQPQPKPKLTTGTTVSEEVNVWQAKNTKPGKPVSVAYQIQVQSNKTANTSSLLTLNSDQFKEFTKDKMAGGFFNQSRHYNENVYDIAKIMVDKVMKPLKAPVLIEASVDRKDLAIAIEAYCQLLNQKKPGTCITNIKSTEQTNLLDKVSTPIKHLKALNNYRSIS